MSKQISNIIRERIAKAQQYYDIAKEQGSEDYYYWQGYMDGLDQLEDILITLTPET